jgi:hypothetical protein
MNNLFLSCLCSSHVLQATVDEDKNVEISIWQLGRTRSLSWKERLRWIWRILRTGDPWADQILIDRKQGKSLEQFLKQNLD